MNNLKNQELCFKEIIFISHPVRLGTAACNYLPHLGKHLRKIQPHVANIKYDPFFKCYCSVTFVFHDKVICNLSVD